MAVNGISPFSKIRLSGLGPSGLDTDSLVSQLMKVERIPVDKLGQKRQLSQWRTDAYRSIITSLSGYKSDFMDYLKPAANMLSQTSYKKFNAVVTDAVTGLTSTGVVSAGGSVDAAAGTHKITVNQLATADVAESMVSFTGTAAPTFPLNVGSKGFQIILDGGATQTITFAPGTAYNNVQDLAVGLQGLIDAQVGAGKVGVSYDSSNRFMISTTGATKSIQLKVGTDGLGTNDALVLFNITQGTINYTGITKALASTTAITAGDLTSINTGNPKNINITVDGVTKQITLGTAYASAAAIATDLTTKIATAFGGGKVNVTEAGGILTFAPAATGINRITLSTGTTDDGLQYLHFASGASNRINSGWTLGQIAGQLATPLTFSGGTTTVTGTGTVDDAYVAAQTWSGKEFNMTVDGVAKKITFTSNPATVVSLVSTMQGLIDTAFGAGKVTVGGSSGTALTFTRSAGVGYMTFNSGSTTPTNIDALSLLKVNNASSATGQIKFTINNNGSGAGFTINASDTLAGMMNTINSDSTAKVNMAYDEVSDKFRITATQLGAGDNIVISQSAGNFFSGVSQIGTGSPVTTQGVDANVTIDGQTLTRSSNTITVNGVTYNLLSKNSTAQNVTLNVDVDTIYNNISGFVKKYNEIIDTINGKLSEKYDRNYQPLTDDQRKAMKDDDIKKWEEKAKTGLLRSDPILQNIVLGMRKALIDKVGADSTTLSGIGITTDIYQTKGRLVINESTLRTAIQGNPDKIMNLFSKQSTSQPIYKRTLTSADRTIRYNEEGLAQRFSDIINDNISTFRDSGGKKGTLLEKAGQAGDTTEFTSTLYKEISGYDTKITDLNKKLIDKENRYYQKFATLEKMLSRMTAQGGWLSAQLGGGKQ